MMRRDLVRAIQTLLAETGQFAGVVGLGDDSPDYPLARVWISGCPTDSNLGNRPEAFLDLRVAVQIEVWTKKDSTGQTDEGPLYDLVDVAFGAIHGKKLPGKGSQPLIVYDAPGFAKYSNDAPAVYTMQVSARVWPLSFSLT